jgi:hypothetical protein
MKTVFCRVLKAPQAGDDIRICYTGPRGGMTEAAHIVQTSDLWRRLAPSESPAGRQTWTKQDNPEDEPAIFVLTDGDDALGYFAKILADVISRQWSGEMFAARARGTEIIITCQQDDQTFFAMMNGTTERGAEYIAVE